MRTTTTTKKTTTKKTTTKKTTTKKTAPATKPKKTREPPLPLSKQAAAAALDLETRAIKKLQKDVARNAWMIGKRLAQIVRLELHTAGGFATVQDYAEEVLGIGRSTAFIYMRVAEAFSEEVTATFGMQRLERGLAYIARTPEDEEAADLPSLAIRVPTAEGDVVEKPFTQVTIRELNDAVRRESAAAAGHAAAPQRARLADHAKALADANAALDAAVGPADAARAEVTLRDDGGDVVVDVRGVPRVHAAAAMAALARAFK